MNKQIAALLFGHSYQLEDAKGLRYDIVGVLTYTITLKRTIPNAYNNAYPLESLGIDFKVLCRPLSDLTKPMENGEIPFKLLGFERYGGEIGIMCDWGDNHRGVIHPLEYEEDINLLYKLHFKPSQIPEEWVKWID